MTAQLTFLTGSKAGTAIQLVGADVTIGRDPTCTVAFPPSEALVSARHATLCLEDARYVLRDDGSSNGTFVNGKKLTGDRILQHGDLVQFGAGGPGARFVVGQENVPMPTLDPSEMVRASEILAATTPSGAAGDEPDTAEISTTREMLTVAVQRGMRNRRGLLLVAAVAAIGVAAAFIWQHRSKTALERALAELSESLASERESRSALAADIAAFQVQADSLQRAIAEEQGGFGNNPRIDPDAVRELSRGVALLVFTYGYAEVNGDRLLRYDLNDRGQVRLGAGPGGRPAPILSFSGAGNPVQHQGTATGFLIDSTNVLITNRHVARPWAEDEYLTFLRTRNSNVEGRFIDLRAYFPPGGQSYPLIVERISTEADVAIARFVGPPPRRKGLSLATTADVTSPGNQFVLIAYPTGLHNLLYRESRSERESILQTAGSDYRMLAAELAARRLVHPLVMRGNISDITAGEVIHTAATTMGASGGPLIDLLHGVFGVHYASVRSPAPGDPFRTQRGVPIRFAWEILPLDVRRILERQR